jgi:uncharacterized protein (DUF433 family)
MNIPPELKDILDADPQYLSGAVRFIGTVPLQALIDTLDEGGVIEDFLEEWPNVPREYAETFIHWQQNQSRQTFGLDLAG